MTVLPFDSPRSPRPGPRSPADREDLEPFDPVAAAEEDASDAVAYSWDLTVGSGLRFPWTAVDQMVGPLLPSWFVLVGGRAKAGKSAMLRTLFHAWTSLHRRVMYVGTEQAAFLLRMMWAAERLNLPMAAILDPLHPDHPAILRDLEEAQVDAARSGAIIVAEADLSVERFIYWMRQAYKLQCDTVILDHFHRLARGVGPMDNPWASRGDAARQIKNAAEKSGMLVVAGAQMKHGEGGPLLGEFDVPGPGSWAETADLRREADVAVQIWKPFRPGVKSADLRAAKQDPARLSQIVQRNTVALRTDAHRYNGDAEASKFARLRLTNGRLDTWRPEPEDTPAGLGL